MAFKAHSTDPDDHKKLYWYNKIVAAFPSLANDPTVQAFDGDPERVYMELVNQGFISSADISGKLDIDQTVATEVKNSFIRRLSLGYATATDSSDVFQLLINGVKTLWNNEWGALRGTSPYSFGDALVRAIRSNSDGITSGNFIELQDRRTGANSNNIYARRWTDGALIRSGNQMADSIILGPTAPIPAGLPAGTIVVRTT